VNAAVNRTARLPSSTRYCPPDTPEAVCRAHGRAHKRIGRDETLYILLVGNPESQQNTPRAVDGIPVLHGFLVSFEGRCRALDATQPGCPVQILPTCRPLTQPQIKKPP